MDNLEIKFYSITLSRKVNPFGKENVKKFLKTITNCIFDQNKNLNKGFLYYFDKEDE
ncbi:hypothetical protein ACQKP0_02420 [Heyndrickxia sp. NPDC080065]|uniref:hypothetical protein n=1 Tax=Heyndrickxia sp. NPDC080065 TaxID=3390568 RepID=UPI003D034821